MAKLQERIRATKAAQPPNPMAPEPMRPEWREGLRKLEQLDPNRPILDQIEELAEVDDRVSEYLEKRLYRRQDAMSLLRPFAMGPGTGLGPGLTGTKK